MQIKLKRKQIKNSIVFDKFFYKTSKEGIKARLLNSDY